MTAPLLAAAVVVAVVSVGCGVLLVVARAAVATGVLAVVGGGLGLLSCWLLTAADARGPGRVAAVLAGAVVAPVAVGLYPVPPPGRRRWVLPAVVAPSAVATGFTHDSGVVGTAAFVTALLLVALVWWRLESEPEHRRPMLWLAFAAGTCGLLGLLLVFAGETTSGTLSTASALAVQAGVPIAAVVGVLRPESIDVRGLVVRVVVVTVVAVGYFAAFVGTDAAARVAGVPLGVRAYAALGLALALAVHPASVVLRGVVDRMLFGDRPDPISAAARVAGRLGDDPGPALDAVRDALAVPWVALRAADGTTLGSSGTEVTHSHVVPLPDNGSGPPAVLHVGLRPGDLTMPVADRRVLDLVAPLMTQILRAQALTAAVQASRGHVVAAVEEERRRIRRDLHDGLGPTLTGVAFSIDAVRNTVQHDPDAAVEMLRAVRADTTEAIGHVRRIVYGMRPPALDELGLVGAVRQRADGLRSTDGRPVRVTVAADGDLPVLPAAVEVAAFRIAVEALTNVARHAQASTAAVTVAVSERPDGGRRLLVEVADDGRAKSSWDAGVGLESMHERAAEVGGVVRCGPTAVGGRVEASLPLPADDEVRAG